MRRIVLLLLLFVPLAARAQSNADSLHKFFADYFEEQVRDSPEFATNLGRHEHDDRWTDWSKAGRDLRRSHVEARLKQLNAFSTEGLSEEDHLSMRLLRYDLEQRLAGATIETRLLRLGQVFGFHNSVYQAVDRMPARTVKDYENIIARIHAIPAYVDQNLAILDEGIAAKLTQPKIIVDLVQAQIAAQLAQDSSNTALLAAFRRLPSNIPAAEQTRLRDAGIAAYQNDFLPAWQKIQQYLNTTYLPRARATAGLGGVPGGQEDYALLVRRFTTTNMTPAEVHAVGEKELARIEAAMLAIARETGFQGTLAEFDAKLAADPAQHFASKEDMLVYCRNIAKIIEPNLPNQFKHIPLLLYGVRAIPPDREASTPSNAQAPPPDGSAPGWFNLNTYLPEKQARSNKQALVLHEAVPGHVFQISLAREQKGLPEFRRFYGNSAYVEGWALYVESIGADLGMYTDPYSRYGQLGSERFRATRLVVDTGIHAQGWTREQAIAFFKEHAPDQSLAEVDRYISWPGQALSYKIGQLRIRGLRTEAEQKLGARFDVRDFHDVVLRDGVLPLDLLQEQTEHYIQAAQ